MNHHCFTLVRWSSTLQAEDFHEVASEHSVESHDKSHGHVTGGPVSGTPVPPEVRCGSFLLFSGRQKNEGFSDFCRQKNTLLVTLVTFWVG